jgi:hypothetical protein
MSRAASAVFLEQLTETKTMRPAAIAPKPNLKKEEGFTVMKGVSGRW